MSNLYVSSGKATETYRGETYELERREIPSFIDKPVKVWCWEVTTGPAAGHYGGKCGTKAEARKWARNEIRAWEDE